MINISIIIANHRADKLFFQTIRSILNSKLKRFQIIVVNNGLDNDQVLKVKDWINKQNSSVIKLLQIKEGNPSQARNLGATIAQGKYLLFLDNDTQVSKIGLDNLIEYLDSHPKVGAGQLKLLRTKSQSYDSAGELLTSNGFLVERARDAIDREQFNKDLPIFSGKGAAMIVRKDLFEKIGGFDETYVYYWEEPDLFWRVWKSGYEVRFLWMGLVYHAYGTSAKLTPEIPVPGQVYLAHRNHLLTILKNAVGWKLWWMLLSVSLAWVGLELMFLVKGYWQQILAIEKARWWLLLHPKQILVKRGWVMKNLPSSDDWLKQVTVNRSMSWYLGKALAYLTGKGF
jgi:GT2 family glycosyltransferase